MAELAGVLEAKGADYETVDILGIGLTENLERLGSVLKVLAKKGTTVVWHSRSPMPAETSAAIKAAGGAFAAVRVKEKPDLLAVLLESLKDLPADVVKRLKGVAKATDVELKDYAKGKQDEATTWRILYQAAGFAHRDHGDEQACGDVVRALAEGVIVSEGLSPRLKALMDDFQSGARNEMVGKSEQMVETRKRLMMAAKYASANVLILGETGTGKQFAAEYIHSHSDRKGSFRHYNCAYGGSDDMLLDRLFGHMKGAFTGADRTTKGLFDDADGGTLFLDEIGEMGEKVQAMLLTVIETGTFIRVGGCEDDKVRVNVRLVSATNRDLQQMVLDGKFRLDLYQRICEFPVRLAPLRERKMDIALLVRHYWYNMTGKAPTKRQIAALEAYDYPGNVRELIALLKQAKALGEEDFTKILSEHESFNRTLIGGLRERREGVASSVSYPDNLEELLARHTVSVWEKYGRNQAKACAAMGVSPNTLKKYLRLAK